ncbi:DUF368 domain-containing protein [Marinicella meishanensis]|uniref:DUF368 domain-containing protein n=1 Tax=Marinicella meishanensis TaxID=2873263 RepID=UPI001CC177C3|nr:DUF368 domain-containing protein [Marinicella sp. NBU2979]
MTYIFIFLKGMLMGIADLVPGVSGGTMALITGIYERLIGAIAAINIKAAQQVFKGQIKATWQQIDGWFLLSLFSGLLTAVFLFASLIKSLLLNQPLLTWSFFFGLIVASALLLLHQHRSKNPIHWLFLLGGAALGYVLSTQSLALIPAGHVGVLLAGMIAVSAMILPGISGSLILILLGFYETILAAVEQRDWLILALFAAGCAIGLMLFSRLLRWLLARYHLATLYALAGLMLGTLFRVWPWKADSHNILPTAHPEPNWLPALMLMALASAFVWTLFQLDRRR